MRASVDNAPAAVPANARSTSALHVPQSPPTPMSALLRSDPPIQAPSLARCNFAKVAIQIIAVQFKHQIRCGGAAAFAAILKQNHRHLCRARTLGPRVRSKEKFRSHQRRPPLAGATPSAKENGSTKAIVVTRSGLPVPEIRVSALI